MSFPPPGREDPPFRQPKALVIYYAVFPLSGFGGAEEDRTPDPLLAKQVLSQLSYSPLSRKPNRNSESEFRNARKWWAQVDSNH